MTDEEKEAALQRCIIYHMKAERLSYSEAKKKCQGINGATFVDGTRNTLRDAKRVIDREVRRQPNARKNAKDEWMKTCVCAFKNTEGLRRDNRGNAYGYCLAWFNSAERDGSLKEICSYSLEQCEDEIRAKTMTVRRGFPGYDEKNLQVEGYGDKTDE